MASICKGFDCKCTSSSCACSMECIHQRNRRLANQHPCSCPSCDSLHLYEDLAEEGANASQLDILLCASSFQAIPRSVVEKHKNHKSASVLQSLVQYTNQLNNLIEEEGLPCELFISKDNFDAKLIELLNKTFGQEYTIQVETLAYGYRLIVS